MNVSPGQAGILVWVVWVLIGLFEALVAQRFTSSRRILMFDIIVGIAFAVLGGYASVCCFGETPVKKFLISLLAATVVPCVVLLISGALIRRFTTTGRRGR